jgi:hypothetical protein
MCTLGAKKIGGRFLIFKNRDREYSAPCRVVREGGRASKLLIVDSRGHCEGMNGHGIGFVEAMLQPFPRVRHRTISQLARRILDQNSLEQAISVVKRNKTSCNLIISDAKRAFIVERTPCEFAATRLKDGGVLTNLSIKLDRRNGSKRKDVREWASARYSRAKKLIGKVKSLKGIIRLLSDKEGWPDRSICSGGGWWIPTRCSYIYDLEKRTIYFCTTRPDLGKFRKYSL